MAAIHRYGISSFNHEGLTIGVKAATDADFPFCWSLYRDFMQPLVKTGARENDRKFKAHIKGSFFSNHAAILTIDDKRAGWLELEEDDTAIHMHQLHLVPAYQRQGIGSIIIDQILVIATHKSKCVKLEVLRKNNGAFCLYRRMGFRIVRADAQKYFMSIGSSG